MSSKHASAARLDRKPMRHKGEDDAFYVGYAAHAPEVLAKFNRSVVLLALLGAGLIAAATAATMKPLPEAHFEFGTTRSFTGEIQAFPVPSLLVARPGLPGAADQHTRHLLTLPGKHGAGPLIEKLDGDRVQLSGTLAWRGNQSLIEVVEDSVVVLEAAATGSDVKAGIDRTRLESREREDRTLRGEIVGAKCYLGVMVPGESRVHQACASLCIRGGVPPLFVSRDDDGAVAFLLLDEDGHALGDELLDLVGGTVELRGHVTRMQEWNLLWLDEAGIAAARSNAVLGFEPVPFRSTVICSLSGGLESAGRASSSLP